jgi:transcription antitermination factor NusG
MTKWCAIRTLPGAQQPQREYAVEDTSRGKGYRIVPSLNPHMSAVEQALTRAGFVHYMPVDFKVVRNRKKTFTYTIRRFALLPGYVFVHGVTDFPTLERVPGVGRVVSIDGVPLPIPVQDIMVLRTVEAKSEARADRDILKITSQATSNERKAAAKALAQAKRKLVPEKVVKILWGDAVGRQATVAGWGDGNMVKLILDKLDAAVLVPYDTLRIVNSDLLAAE